MGELFWIQITEQLYNEYIYIERRKLASPFLVGLLNHYPEQGRRGIYPNLKLFQKINKN